jgi:DNA mismatch repair protein MutS2
MAIKTLDRKDLHQANFLKTIKTEAERWQQLNASLENEHQAIAAKYQQLESEFAARERERQREFEQRMVAAISTFETEAAQYIAQLKDPNLAAKLTKEREKRVFQLKRQANDSSQWITKTAKQSGQPSAKEREEQESPLTTEFFVGDRVQTEMGQQGTIEEIKGEEIFVRVGAMRFKATAANLKLLERASKKKTGLRLPAGVNFTQQETESVTGELNVIGTTTEEACERVDKFLDRAFLANYDRVRIVHGTGKGILRQAIGNLLKAHPHVANYHQAGSSEGGAGATIVELRQ